MTFDPVSREESAARAIQRSLGALDFARRMAEQPREGVERVLRETLGQTPATGGNREMTSRTDAQFARRDFVRDAAASRSRSQETVDLNVTSRPGARDLLRQSRRTASVAGQRPESFSQPITERTVPSSNFPQADSPDDFAADQTPSNEPRDISLLLAQLRPELDRLLAEARREMQSLADELRAEAARHDSARLVAMQV